MRESEQSLRDRWTNEILAGLAEFREDSTIGIPIQVAFGTLKRDRVARTKAAGTNPA